MTNVWVTSHASVDLPWPLELLITVTSKFPVSLRIAFSQAGLLTGNPLAISIGLAAFPSKYPMSLSISVIVNDIFVIQLFCIAGLIGEFEKESFTDCINLLMSLKYTFDLFLDHS